MQIDAYLDIAKLKSHVENGLVDARLHKTLPLVLYCYSRKCVQEDQWDDVTTKTRGLIVDVSLIPGKHGNIVARPWEKFFNISTTYRPETWITNLPAEKPVVNEKLDGSMGTFWTYDFGGATHYGVASKGSFHSEHADWATDWLKIHNASRNQAMTWPVGYTPMFEMICQSIQTHPVHYDELDNNLVLTALINIETGEEASYESLHYFGMLNDIAVVDIFDKTVGKVLEEDRKNKEGYVLSWARPGQTPLKVKVKHESFLALQKISHSATPKNILQMMIEGKPEMVNEWMTTQSPDLNRFVQGWFARFSQAFGNILVTVREIVVKARMTCTTRKEIAEFLNRKENKFYSSACFAMIDEKDTGKVIWKYIKESIDKEDDVLFVTDEEDDGDKE